MNYITERMASNYEDEKMSDISNGGALNTGKTALSKRAILTDIHLHVDTTLSVYY